MKCRGSTNRLAIGLEAPRFSGVTAIAKKLRISKCYVSLVLHGRIKPSERVARGLRRFGVAI